MARHDEVDKFVDRKCRRGIPTDRNSAPPWSSAKRETSSTHSKPDMGKLRGVVNEASWGEAQATQRYGGSTRTFPAPADKEAPQKLGDPGNLRGPSYPNDVPNDWRRGAGTKPGYARSAVYLGKNAKLSEQGDIGGGRGGKRPFKGD